MNYKSNRPYPRPMVEKENIYYAKLLLDAYAGEVSEESAIHLYLYQGLIENDSNKDFATIISHISYVEMHHLKLLGETIKLLGLKPVCGTLSRDNKITFWSCKNVNYAINLKEMLEIDIKSEVQAVRNYEHLLTIINDKYVKELIARIIEDEQIHINIFKYFYKKLVMEGSI